MQALSQIPRTQWKIVFTDIDGTITTDGQIGPESYNAIWRLYRAGIDVVPVTGRPAGWCEMIARTWPVHGVIGENGALYFRMNEGQMQRYFYLTDSERLKNRQNLDRIRDQILKEVPGAGVASDQFTRLFDLAIDFCEDVPALDDSAISKILGLFQSHGAVAKVSNIHVNGWFGDYNKLTTCKRYCRNELKHSFEDLSGQIAFIGDSPNDEPMFKDFKNSFAVANIKDFVSQLRDFPSFISSKNEGQGFVQIVDAILATHCDR